jgi:hypothetical protein
MSSDCADEAVTQHHSKSGHGPVAPEETVLLALFDTGSPRTEVHIDDFPVKSLQNNNLSIARLTYTSRADFDTYVIGNGSKGTVTSVAHTTAAAIRNMDDYVVSGAQPPKSGRSICVLDKVEPDDHDGHASLGFSESQQDLSPKQRGIIRPFIRADLRTVFSNVIALDSILPKELEPSELIKEQNQSPETSQI